MRCSLISSICLLLFVSSGPLSAEKGSDSSLVYLARYVETVDGQRTLISREYVPRRSDRLGPRIREVSFPQVIDEQKDFQSGTIVELSGISKRDVLTTLVNRNVTVDYSPLPQKALATTDELITLVDSGPPQNRIDFVFLGDGYTLAERGKFIRDMERLAREMFADSTFRSYLPIFNVHAVFRPSAESGIGRGAPRDTAYGLYRPGDTLRAIYWTKATAARTSCHVAPDCDYPIIIANDPYYGGLGGEFAVSTSSPGSGTVVLRHELGHTVGRVGEEYDGGGYFGANYSSSIPSIKWRHWLTEASDPRAEPAAALLIDWPWHYLGDGPLAVKLKSDGRFAFRGIRFSASGLSRAADGLLIILEGVETVIESPLNGDRLFYDISLDGGFSRGRHNLSFSENLQDGDNWLCSLTAFEYGSDFHFEKDFIGAYPVFSKELKSVGYRPTNESCLMRNMKEDDFCPVCKENLWLQMLNIISLLDDLDIDYRTDTVRVSLRLPELGQFRPEDSRIPGERVQIKWFHNSRQVHELSDLKDWTAPYPDAGGQWRVEIEFITPEVRHDPYRLLQFEQDFTLYYSKHIRIKR